LEVRTNARASAILFDGKRASGIRYIAAPGGPAKQVMARREVILSSGTVNTARLLQVSGVGPAELLGSLGVPVVHALRGVGANFRDHYASRFVMRAKPGTETLNGLARGVNLGMQVARWALKKPSILATAPSHVHVFWKSFEGLDAPDLQCVFTPGSYAEGKVYVLDDYPGVTAGAWQHRPESHGWVKARSTNVFEDPEINPNYLSDPMDVRVHLGGMRLLRRMLNTPELSRFLEAETLPGPSVDSDDELLDFAKKNGSTTYHLIGTARMGPETDPTAVVNDRLLVHGMQGLRVVDASIMPSMPSANTYATTLMIAEKAADFILGRQAAAAA
ncbi:MAG: choline dehydrogenase, partial [Acetobacteraceae bacterium]